MENFKGMKKGTSKTLKAATAAFVLTSGVAVSTSVVGPDVAQAQLGEQAEIYHPSDNPAEESITISSENTADNPARVSGALSEYWIGYYTTYEDGETQYTLRNEQGSKFFSLNEGTQTINLIHDSGDEQGYFNIAVNVDTANIDDEVTETPAEEAPSDPDEVPEEAPAEDTTDEGTEEAAKADSTEDATTANVSNENAGSDSEKSEEGNATASEEDNNAEVEEITSSEDVEKLPRTGGDTAPLSAVGGLMVLLSSAVLALRKKFSKQ